MPVSALVVTLSDDPSLATAALRRLELDPAIAVGEVQGARAALALDTPSKAADQAAWRRLNEDPGVLFSELVMVAFDDEAPTAATAANALKVQA